MKKLIAALVFCVVMCISCADNTNTIEISDQEKELQRQIEELQRQLDELQGQ